MTQPERSSAPHRRLHVIMSRDLCGPSLDGRRCLGRPGPADSDGRVSPRPRRPRPERRFPVFLVRIYRALNDAGARYLLIGGFAVMAHGAGRFTKDIDLLVDDAPANEG